MRVLHPWRPYTTQHSCAHGARTGTTGVASAPHHLVDLTSHSMHAFLQDLEGAAAAAAAAGGMAAAAGGPSASGAAGGGSQPPSRAASPGLVSRGSYTFLGSIWKWMKYPGADTGVEYWGMLPLCQSFKVVCWGGMGAAAGGPSAFWSSRGRLTATQQGSISRPGEHGWFALMDLSSICFAGMKLEYDSKGVMLPLTRVCCVDGKRRSFLCQHE